MKQLSHYQAKRIDRLRDELRTSGIAHNEAITAIGQAHTEAMAVAESKRLDAVQSAESRRIDANRATDVAAVILANTRAELTASALADKVESARTAAADTVQQTTENFTLRIKPLEDARYENAGRRGGQIDFGKIMQAGILIAIAVAGLLLSGHIH